MKMTDVNVLVGNNASSFSSLLAVVLSRFLDVWYVLFVLFNDVYNCNSV